ncbi:MAG: hypothetical protein KatS3mg003_1235 [Candidatus Nitrosocaldaceae archaeon]|nr:MAG: hypothetical protein KatS3mg003_1235 [Candidatus Nitrosocaldaceae archaeon]
MSIDREYMQRAKLVYSKMTLKELLAEENLMQRYMFKHANDKLTRRLYSLLTSEIDKRLR